MKMGKLIFITMWNFLLGLIADLYINTLTVFRFNRMKQDLKISNQVYPFPENSLSLLRNTWISWKSTRMIEKHKEQLQELITCTSSVNTLLGSSKT